MFCNDRVKKIKTMAGVGYMWYLFSNFLSQKLKWLTSGVVDRLWPEVSAREPGGPDDSEPREWTITGERPWKGEAVLRKDMEREEGGEGDWCGPGERLRGGVDGFTDWEHVEEEPDAEASRCLWAKRALLALAELFWAESLGGQEAERLGSGSVGWLPGWDFSRSGNAVWKLSETLFSQGLLSLFFAFPSSSCPLFLSSMYSSSFSLSGWPSGWPSDSPGTGRIYNIFDIISIFLVLTINFIVKCENSS